MDRRLGQDGLPSGTDMKYAHIDENNQIIGWYSSDVHDNIPEPNIEVSEEQWQTAIDNAHNKINQDGSTETADFRSQEEIDQWNAEEYLRNRKSDYPQIRDQLDMIYWDMMNGTSNWVDLISSVKEKHPKP